MLVSWLALVLDPIPDIRLTEHTTQQQKQITIWYMLYAKTAINYHVSTY